MRNVLRFLGFMTTLPLIAGGLACGVVAGIFAEWFRAGYGLAEYIVEDTIGPKGGS